MSAVSLELRELDLQSAHDDLEALAIEWLDARVSGSRSQKLDERLDGALHRVRQAERRLHKTRRRLHA